MTALHLADNPIAAPGKPLLELLPKLARLTALTFTDTPFDKEDKLATLRVLLARPDLKTLNDGAVVPQTAELARRTRLSLDKSAAVEDVTATFKSALETQEQLEEAALAKLRQQEEETRQKFSQRREDLRRQMAVMAAMVATETGLKDEQPI